MYDQTGIFPTKGCVRSYVSAKRMTRGEEKMPAFFTHFQQASSCNKHKDGWYWPVPYQLYAVITTSTETS